MKLKIDKTTNPRYVVFQILQRTGKYNFSHILLSRYLEKSNLSSRDKRLATELVNGIYRNFLFLEWAISECSSISLDKINRSVMELLRLGAYQILFLERIPSYAAISETVEISKIFKPHIVKFINAVLRAIDRRKDELKKGPRGEDNIKKISIYYSHPEWLVNRWFHRWGKDFTIELCKFNNIPPGVTALCNTLKVSMKELTSKLSKNNIEILPSEFVPDGFEILTGLRAEDLDCYKDGLFTLQGESSMLVSSVLAPAEGDNVLDMCAAPGNKTIHMAQLMKNKGTILAVDISGERLKFLDNNCNRLGIKIINTFVCDSLNLDDSLKENFDKILLDAPCSGTGVLSRRSDLRWKKSLRDIEKLSLIQSKMLEKASYLLKPGGSMAYSVCSIEPEEGEYIVKNFISNHHNFIIDNSDIVPSPGNNTVSYFSGLILPPIHKIEGFFICKFRKIK